MQPSTLNAKMATVTVTDIVTRTVNATCAATASSTNRATPQGGVFEHVNPTHYDTKNPIVLFIIQAAIVIILTRVIHFPLTYLRQPRVIAEVLTGIILGPSIMGRIPGFSTTIFPTASMPAFSLAANLGLVLFLFLVGLEVDLRYLLSNWRIALSVGALGMAIPFGLGAGIAYGLYHQFRDEPGLAPIGFGTYLLFIGIAMAITAFPVLCRILTSLKLLGTPVGVIVLSAGVGNDVVGWILLALCVALVNSGAGLTALYIFLVAVGYCLFLGYGVRPVFVMVLRKSGSLANGPTQSVVALTVLMVLASAFFTQIIGIHAIFGAFMIGLICPHEGGFAIKLTEKIEDLVSVLFLPLYFALSGLNTNLGLLDTGTTWGYVVGVCAIAFFGKIFGGSIAARANGLVWRESLTIGCLMSCKGLVELIVLNIGFQAKILSQRTFTIFVVMALITTFATTPLVVWLYPPWYQQKLEAWKKGKIDWEGNLLHPEEDESEGSDPGSPVKHEVARKVLVYLRLDGLPSLFTIVSLLSSKRVVDESHQPALKSDFSPPKRNSKALESVHTLHRPVRVHGLRLMELTERESSVMKVTELEDYANRDPIIKAFGTFGQSKDIPIGGQVAVVPERSFSSTLMRRARDLKSDFILIPWSETGTMSEYPSLFDEKTGNPLSNREFTKMVVETFEKARSFCHVGVLIDRGVFATQEKIESPTTDTAPYTLARTNTGISVAERNQSVVEFMLPDSGRQRIIVVVQGGDDDMYAVKLALQLARHDVVDLKIVKIGSKEDASDDGHDFDFSIIKSGITESMKHRVIIEESDGEPLQALIKAVNEPSAAETVTLMGRGSVDMSASVQTTGSREDTRVLGPFATTVLSAVREKALKTGLMIVQARRDNDDLRRKTTNMSISD